MLIALLPIDIDLRKKSLNIYPIFLDPSTLSFPRPQSLLLPKVEQDPASSVFTSDSISADQGIVVKSENRSDSASISSQVLNEIRPIHQSDIPGFERNAIEERQLAALGKTFACCSIDILF